MVYVTTIVRVQMLCICLHNFALEFGGASLVRLLPNFEAVL